MAKVLAGLLVERVENVVARVWAKVEAKEKAKEKVSHLPHPLTSLCRSFASFAKRRDTMRMTVGASKKQREKPRGRVPIPMSLPCHQMSPLMTNR